MSSWTGMWYMWRLEMKDRLCMYRSKIKDVLYVSTTKHCKVYLWTVSFPCHNFRGHPIRCSNHRWSLTLFRTYLGTETKISCKSVNENSFSWFQWYNFLLGHSNFFFLMSYYNAYRVVIEIQLNSPKRIYLFTWFSLYDVTIQLIFFFL